MKKVLVIILACVLTTSCQKAFEPYKNAYNRSNVDYFPCNNYAIWVYRNEDGLEGTITINGSTMQCSEDIPLPSGDIWVENKAFWKSIERFSECDPYNDELELIPLFILPKNTGYWDLPANATAQWYCSLAFTAKLSSRPISVEVPAGKFNKCAIITYTDINNGTKYDYIFAPNIGIVKICGPITWELIDYQL